MNEVNEVLANMLNEKSKNDNNGRIVYVDLESLISSEDNNFPMDQIEELAANIRNVGLQQPLTGMKTPEGIVLNAGHRRRAALQLLTDRNIPYTFFGREILGEAPIIYLQKELSELEIRIALISSNAHRDMDVESKVAIVRECLEVYTQLCSIEKKPEGLKRDWISQMTGFSSRSIQGYLTEIEGKDKADKKKVDPNIIYEIISSITNDDFVLKEQVSVQELKEKCAAESYNSVVYPEGSIISQISAAPKKLNFTYGNENYELTWKEVNGALQEIIPFTKDLNWKKIKKLLEELVEDKQEVKDIVNNFLRKMDKELY